MEKLINHCYQNTNGPVSEPFDFRAMFVTVKKYEVLYRKALPNFQKEPMDVYALPLTPTPKGIYRGLDREGLDLADKHKRCLTRRQRELAKRIFQNFEYANELMADEDSAREYISLFRDEADAELLFVRLAGDDAAVPEGYRLLGYDVAWEPDYAGGFSAINDCMFICRWHGCDAEGTLFLEDFRRLNENGLFDDPAHALAYLHRYAAQDWTETGDYCIWEIYAR